MNQLQNKLYELLFQVPKSELHRGCKLILGIDSQADHVIVSYWRKPAIYSEVEKLPLLSGAPQIDKVGNNSVHFYIS
jgi:hypothetical protein